MNKNRVRQWVLFLLGVIFTAMGVSLITLPGLGSSPASSLSYALTFVFSGSFGLYMFFVHTTLFVGQVLILRRELRPLQLLQVPALGLFSICLDFWMFALRGLVFDPYLARLLVILVGCCILGFGVALQVLADVLILPAEGFVKVVAIKLKREFGVIKTFYDIAMVAAAVGISLACLGRVEGVGVATLLAALITGAVSRFWRVRIVAFLTRWGNKKENENT